MNRASTTRDSTEGRRDRYTDLLRGKKITFIPWCFTEGRELKGIKPFPEKQEI